MNTYLPRRRSSPRLVPAALTLLLAMPLAVSAQTNEPPQPPRGAIVLELGVRIATRLNTPSRFYGPVRTAESLRAMMARPGMTRDVESVFQAAGLPHLAADAVRVLSEARGLRDVTVAVGSRLEWMALRHNGKPEVIRNVRWGGQKAFAAFEFSLDDGARGYTFVVPTDCANLSLASTGPSPKAAAAAEAARAEEARRAEEANRAAAARAEEARRAEELKAAEMRRAEEARAAEARKAEEARRAEEVARRAEEARQTAEAAERDRRARVDVFFDVLGGKERRLREVGNGPAGVVNGRCATLVGGKAGVDLRLGTSNWRMVPAVGVAANTRDTDNTSLFGDVELNYWIGDKGFLGTGIGVWDVTHSETVTGSWLLHAGRELARSSGDVRLLLVGEGRLFFDHADDVANNYLVWAGLRVVFR